MQPPSGLAPPRGAPWHPITTWPGRQHTHGPHPLPREPARPHPHPTVLTSTSLHATPPHTLVTLPAWLNLLRSGLKTGYSVFNRARWRFHQSSTRYSRHIASIFRCVRAPYERCHTQRHEQHTHPPRAHVAVGVPSSVGASGRTPHYLHDDTTWPAVHPTLSPHAARAPLACPGCPLPAFPQKAPCLATSHALGTHHFLIVPVPCPHRLPPLGP